MLLGDWLETWLELYVDPSALAENTKKCYHRAVRAVLSICPPLDRSAGILSDTPLEELSPLALRRWLLAVAKETPRAAQLDRVMLSRALTVAAKLGLCRPGLIDEDVCPQIVHEPRKALVLDADQMRRYMAAAAQTDVAPVLLLCCCGLRRGEAMGARWQDVDLAAGVLRVEVQRQDDVALPLKSRASHRAIALPASVLAVLRRWPRSDCWLCDCTQKHMYAVHHRIVTALGLPAVTPHGLRHSMATIAAMHGEPIKCIQAALGHAHYGLTADLYANHLPDVAAVTANFLSA